MRKIALVLMLITTIPTYATTMCAANDSVGIILDPNIAIKGYSYNTNTWWAWSNSWTVYGVSACLNSNKGKGMGGTVAHLHDTDNDGNDHLVTGSEKYGRYCWCRLTHPVSSLWAFYNVHGSAPYCVSICTDRCGNHLLGRVALGEGLFGSISN